MKHKIVLTEAETQRALVDFAQKKIGLSPKKFTMEPINLNTRTKEMIVEFEVKE